MKKIGIGFLIIIILMLIHELGKLFGEAVRNLLHGYSLIAAAVIFALLVCYSVGHLYLLLRPKK